MFVFLTRQHAPLRIRSVRALHFRRTHIARPGVVTRAAKRYRSRGSSLRREDTRFSSARLVLQRTKMAHMRNCTDTDTRGARSREHVATLSSVSGPEQSRRAVSESLQCVDIFNFLYLWRGLVNIAHFASHFVRCAK